MPNRILKESICYSDQIDQLSAFEETVFYRLIVNVDDYGRIDARPNFLRSKLFVTKQGITVKSIDDAVRTLATVGLVEFYEVNNDAYLRLPTWHEHQRIRKSKAKYPAPPDGNALLSEEEKEEFAASCRKLPQVAASCGELPLARAKNPNPNPNPNPKECMRTRTREEKPKDEDFDRFWAEYPRKVGKKDAQKAWKKLKPSKSLVDKMINAVEEQKRSDQWNRGGGRYIPNPSTWINQGRWDDELKPAKGKSAPPPDEKPPTMVYLEKIMKDGGWDNV
jgi:hypothetical protein